MVTRGELIDLVNKVEQSYFMKNIKEKDTEKFKEKIRALDVYKSEVRSTEAYVERKEDGSVDVYGEIRTTMNLMNGNEIELVVVETTEPNDRSHIEIYMDEHVAEDRIEDLYYYIQEIQAIEQEMS